MKKKLWTVIILLCVFSAAGVLLFPQLKSGGKNSSGQAIARASSNALVPVITAQATQELFTETLEALGTAMANESVVITPTLEERVAGIFFDDGDDVRQGQVLLKLDNSEAQFMLAEAKATLKEQQQQYERIRRLAKTNATSRSKLDEERSLLEIANANVALMQARLEDYTIRAPFAGILGIRRISPGAVVDSDTVITTLDDTSTIKLDFTVPEIYLGVLKKGMVISARSPAYADRKFEGRVSTISSRVDPETRTLTIRARIPNPDRFLKPGMLLTVDLVKSRSRTLVIPEEAVILEKDQKYVLAVTAESTVAKTKIITGRRSPGKVEVLSGLSSGQQVIVKGISRVRPGSAVNVVEVRKDGRMPG